MMERFIEQLRSEYPDVTISWFLSTNSREAFAIISCDEHRCTAIALIERSSPHMHRISAETLLVEEGELTLHLEGEEPRLMGPGDAAMIVPGKTHWIEGHPVAKLHMTSSPPWKPEDHVLAQPVSV